MFEFKSPGFDKSPTNLKEPKKSWHLKVLRIDKSPTILSEPGPAPKTYDQTLKCSFRKAAHT
jgi:hypothetical protein